MAPNSTSCWHGGHHLDILKTHPLQIFIIESLICQSLEGKHRDGRENYWGGRYMRVERNYIKVCKWDFQILHGTSVLRIENNTFFNHIIYSLICPLIGLYESSLPVEGRQWGCWSPICQVWVGWCLSGKEPGSHSLWACRLGQCLSWATGRSDWASAGHDEMRSAHCNEPRQLGWSGAEKRHSVGAC